MRDPVLRTGANGGGAQRVLRAGANNGGEMRVCNIPGRPGARDAGILAGAISGGAQRVLRAGANNGGEMRDRCLSMFIFQESRYVCSKKVDVYVPRKYNGI